MRNKNKPLSINISRFINSNKPITSHQLQNIQKQIVTNMVVMGRSAEKIYDFVKESNKIKRHLNSKSLSQAGKNRIYNLLNAGEIVKEDGKHIFKIEKPRITKFSKSIGSGQFDIKILKSLEKRGLISKTIKSLINQRKSNKIHVTLDNTVKNILDILDSFSNPEKYFKDLQRICYEHLGIWFETYEEYANWRMTLR